jgi:sRNA-binding carbon storage regulator CsrA
VLVIARKRNESVIVRIAGREVARIELVDIRGDKARLGFHAQPEVEFLRDELEGEGARHQASGTRQRHTDDAARGETAAPENR